MSRHELLVFLYELRFGKELVSCQEGKCLTLNFEETNVPFVWLCNYLWGLLSHTQRPKFPVNLYVKIYQVIDGWAFQELVDSPPVLLVIVLLGWNVVYHARVWYLMNFYRSVAKIYEMNQYHFYFSLSFVLKHFLLGMKITKGFLIHLLRMILVHVLILLKIKVRLHKQVAACMELNLLVCRGNKRFSCYEGKRRLWVQDNDVPRQLFWEVWRRN